MSTSNIIAAISAAIAAASLVLAFLQYRASRIQNRTETSRRAEQYQHLVVFAARAASQAETAKIIANNTVRGVAVSIEDLRALAEASGNLAEELSAVAEYARPDPARRHHGRFSR